jgi:hypothetical protein
LAIRSFCWAISAPTNSAGVRATYFIDPEGVIRAITHCPLTIGRSVGEILRMVAALQATYSGARLAPADWQQKQPLLLPCRRKSPARRQLVLPERSMKPLWQSREQAEDTAERLRKFGQPLRLSRRKVLDRSEG